MEIQGRRKGGGRAVLDTQNVIYFLHKVLWKKSVQNNLFEK